MAERLRKMEEKRIPPGFDYNRVPNLSTAAREKLEPGRSTDHRAGGTDQRRRPRRSKRPPNLDGSEGKPVNPGYELIEKGLYEFGLELSDDSVQRLYRYLRRLLQANREQNLTAITGWEDVVSKHLLDSLALLKAPLVEGDAGSNLGPPCLMWGSGAGVSRECFLPLPSSRKEHLPCWRQIRRRPVFYSS